MSRRAEVQIDEYYTAGHRTEQHRHSDKCKQPRYSTQYSANKLGDNESKRRAPSAFTVNGSLAPLLRASLRALPLHLLFGLPSCLLGCLEPTPILLAHRRTLSAPLCAARLSTAVHTVILTVCGIIRYAVI